MVLRFDPNYPRRPIAGSSLPDVVVRDMRRLTPKSQERFLSLLRALVAAEAKSCGSATPTLPR